MRFVWVWLCVLLAGTAVVRAAEPSFDYDKAEPLTIEQTGEREQGEAVLRDITYALGSRRNAATIVESKTPITARRAAILFVHWYGPPAPTSNRTTMSTSHKSGRMLSPPPRPSQRRFAHTTRSTS
ncbi:hypothetical protein BH18VER1_BH18VER1_13710 [soil metagenome]